jgi:RHS repeat-associated protein
MYGEKRLGVIKENRFLMKKPTQNGIATPVIVTASKPPVKTSIYTLGKKHYETTDWLGNVRVTYSDKKSWQQNKFALNVSSSLDYYPFGSVMEGRALEITNYRYGFQGQEGDDEVFGKNNLWAYKYRLHDARLGRFFSVDPLADKYPYNSVYAFSENRVIDGVELEGLEKILVELFIYLNSDVRIRVLKAQNGSFEFKYANENIVNDQSSTLVFERVQQPDGTFKTSRYERPAQYVLTKKEKESLENNKRIAKNARYEIFDNSKGYYLSSKLKVNFEIGEKLFKKKEMEDEIMGCETCTKRGTLHELIEDGVKNYNNPTFHQPVPIEKEENNGSENNNKDEKQTNQQE